MKRLSLIIVCTIITFNLYAQSDLTEEFARKISKQSDHIDSLKRALDIQRFECQKYNENVKRLQDSLKLARREIDQLDKFKKRMKEYESLQVQKEDSIQVLIRKITGKQNEIEREKQNCETRLKQENQKCNIEMSSRISDYYLSNSFDYMLSISSKQIIERDLLYSNDTAGVRSLLSDLKNCLYAKECLHNRFNKNRIDSIDAQLLKIRRDSKELKRLLKNLEGYKILNDGLKEMLMNIINLDNTESVEQGPIVNQKRKQDKIYAEISSFLFNYEFKIEEYPYLADLIWELVIRKKQNPDSPIHDLLARL